MRPIGAALVVLAGGLGLLARKTSEARVGGAAGEESTKAVRSALVRAWESKQQALTERAKQGAALAPLRSALQSRVDAATLVDLFASEDWWRAIREDVKVSRLLRAGGPATFGRFEALHEDDGLVEAARAGKPATATVVVKQHAYMAAAVAVGDPGPDAPVLLLANPIDAPLLEDVATAAKAALFLTDDRAPVASAGSAKLRSAITTLLAEPRRGGWSVDPEGRWVAAALPLAGTFHLWAIQAMDGAPMPAGRDASSSALGLSLAAGLLGAGGLFFVLRRHKHGGETPAALPGAAQGPAASSGPSAPEPVATNQGAPAPSLEGKTFGRYKVLRKLADGGMSEIYVAVAFGAEGFTRNFVLKRLRPELAREPEAISQFIDEARVQADLNHSNIVPVFDFGTLGDEYFMTEEYVIGRDVRHLVERAYERTGAAIPSRIAYYIAHATLEALHYAHTKLDKQGRPLDIVHRDVSAMNILVTGQGDVKLFDFGIAKNNKRVTRTQAGMVKGNANFMAPEQARGQAVDSRADLFCLGAVLFYALSYRLLYTGANDLDVLYKAACGPGEVELASMDALPPPASQILRRALAMDPAGRYQTAHEFAADLEPHMASRAEVCALMERLFGDELRRELAA